MGTIERRQHLRILTLKNFRWVLVVVVVFLIAVSLDLTTRGAPSADYGRLYQKHIKPREEVTPRPAIVTEAPPVPDQTAADPLLIAPAAREQEFLSTEPQRPTPIAASTVPVETRGSGNGVNIVGDSGGVVIVRSSENAKKPVLAGGIFKQP